MIVLSRDIYYTITEKQYHDVLGTVKKKTDADYIELRVYRVNEPNLFEPVLVWQACPSFRPSLRVVLQFEALLNSCPHQQWRDMVITQSTRCKGRLYYKRTRGSDDIYRGICE